MLHLHLKDLRGKLDDPEEYEMKPLSPLIHKIVITLDGTDSKAGDLRGKTLHFDETDTTDGDVGAMGDEIVKGLFEERMGWDRMVVKAVAQPYNARRPYSMAFVIGSMICESNPSHCIATWDFRGVYIALVCHLRTVAVFLSFETPYQAFRSWKRDTVL